jgi:hypothetical protein
MAQGLNFLRKPTAFSFKLRQVFEHDKCPIFGSLVFDRLESGQIFPQDLQCLSILYSVSGQILGV